LTVLLVMLEVSIVGLSYCQRFPVSSGYCELLTSSNVLGYLAKNWGTLQDTRMDCNPISGSSSIVSYYF